MLEYLSNLLPRLRQFSETLDKKEILIGQPWVLIDDKMNKQQYIFERGGRLLLSVNGDVKVGRWEYIEAAHSLLIHLEGERVLLNQDFVSKGLLVLKKDGFLNMPWVMANERIIPDLDIDRYIKSLLQENLNIRWIKTENGLDFEYQAGLSEDVLTGTPITVDGQKVDDGMYKVLGQNLWLTVSDSKVFKKTHRINLDTNQGTVAVDMREANVSVGDFVQIEGNPVEDGGYSVENSESVTFFNTSNGFITSVKYKSEALLAYVLLLGITVLVVIILVALL